MNVSNLSVNNVNIASANYVIKQLKSTYTPVCTWSAFIRPTEMRPQNQTLFPDTKLDIKSITIVSIKSVSWVGFVSGNYPLKERNNYVLKFRQNYIRKLHQINVRKLRNKIMQMGSRNYVLIPLGSCIRMTFQKSRQNYVRKLRQISVRKLRNKTM